MLADRGYDADWFRDALEQKGIKPCIAGRKSRSFPPNGVAAAPPSFAKSDGDRRVRDRRKRRRAERRSSASSVDRAGTGARRQPAGFVSLQLATSTRPTASRSQVIAIVRCGNRVAGLFLENYPMISIKNGGTGGIRTLEGLLTLTHFPGVRLRPLGHRSACRFPRRRRTPIVQGASTQGADYGRNGATISGVTRCSRPVVRLIIAQVVRERTCTVSSVPTNSIRRTERAPLGCSAQVRPVTL